MLETRLSETIVVDEIEQPTRQSLTVIGPPEHDDVDVFDSEVSVVDLAEVVSCSLFSSVLGAGHSPATGCPKIFTQGR